MAGTYGHEAEHLHLSEGIYEQSWKEKYENLGDQFLVTGYSCRSQIKRLELKTTKHPIQILMNVI
jgi:Fe-S oxidoreductase